MAEIFIGIPTYKRPDFVRRALGSVLAQAFQDWRCVVSDNPSPEGTGEQVRAHVESLGDPRIQFVQQPDNHGEYGQGRFFWGALRDEPYLTILHDDDCLYPPYLSRAHDALEAHPEVSLFVANPGALNEQGEADEARRSWYLRKHGRTGVLEGPFEILSSLFESGFVPISGTVFRTADLRESGFVDEDCHGNFPFEFNLLLRLGRLGKAGWFCPEELLAFRFHPNSLRAGESLMANPKVVETMLRLVLRYPFTGPVERRRRVLAGRLHRAMALIEFNRGNRPGGRHHLYEAIRYNPYSIRTVCQLLWTTRRPPRGPVLVESEPSQAATASVKPSISLSDS